MARRTAYLPPSRLKDICPVPTLPPRVPRQFQPMAVLVEKKRTLQWDALHATVALALMIHMMGLFTYLVFNPTTRDENYRFFTDVQLASKSEIAVTEIEKPKPTPPPPPPPPPEQPKPQVQPPPTAVQPSQPAPAPKPVKVPSQNPAPKAPVRTNPVARPDSNVPVLTAKHGTGDPVPTGRGGGDPNGVPGGTGQGQGPGGNGTGGTGTGGTGAGGPVTPPPPPGERVHSTTEYSNFTALNIPFPGSDPTGGARTWEDLCKSLNMDYAGDVARRPSVPPIFTGAGNPEHMLGSKAGLVRVSVMITAAGKPTNVAIVRSCGDKELDSVGMYIAMNTSWLPALAYGKPVDHPLEYDIKFASPANPNPTYGQ